MIWFLLIPLLFLAPFLGQFIYSPGSAYSDLVVSHWPNAIYLRQMLAQTGQVPLWSDMILGGTPFAANPLSGIWYPPGWLGVFLPAPFGFNLAMILHLLFGGWGTYRFLRAEGSSTRAALLSGVLFEAMPKVIAHLAAGHVTLVYAVAWTPWLLLAERSAQGRRGWPKYLLGPGLVLGVILLADVRWAAYAGLLWAVYGIANTNRIEIHSKVGNPRGFLKRLISTSGRWVVWGGTQGFLGILLAAPLLLPLAEFTRLSTRLSLSPQDVFTYSLPPDRLIGLLYPGFGAYAEWVTYFGAGGLVLLISALVLPKVWSRTGLWASIFLACLLYSLGSNIPGLDFLTALPGFSLLRVPPRALFLGGFALAILVGLAADEIGKNPFTGVKKRQVQPILLPVTLAMFIVILTGSIFAITRSMPLNFAWGALAVGVMCFWLGLRIKAKINYIGWLNGLLILAVLDLSGVNFLSIQAHAQPVGQSTGEAVAMAIEKSPTQFRTYSPSYSLPQQVAAQSEIQMTDGVDPLQLSTYRDYMALASDIPNSTYSVTLPPFATGDPSVDNLGSIPDLHLLARLNVVYLLTNYNLSTPGLTLKSQSGEIRIYQNTFAFPRAWIEGSTVPVSVDEYSPNRIKLTGTGPGKMVLSEIAYPGWNVRIDGQPAPMLTIDGLLRGVQLPDGMHKIVFEYHPTYLILGLGLAGLAWIAVLAAWIIQGRRS